LPPTIGPGGPIRGRRTSAVDYFPKFFLIAPRGTDIPADLTGQAFSPKLSPVVTVNPGQTILLRFLNAGLLEKTPTLQNQYMTLVAEDGNLLPYSKQQYSSLLPAGKTMDAILAPSAAGYIPLFDRSLNLTNGAASPGGQMRYIWVASAGQTFLAANKLPNGPFNTGTGTVMTTSLPGGFDCGSACQTLSVSYNTGTSLSVGAPADFGSKFTGWSGACTGTADCILTLATPQSVTAAFVPIWVSVPGATPSAPAIAWDSTNSKFHMAARGMDNRIYVGTADPYGALNNDWRALPGGFTPDAPAIAWDVTAQKLYVVARGMDNAIYGVSVNATGAVSPWTKFSSGLTDAAPAIAMNGANLNVVVRGMDNKIYGVTVDPVTWTLSGSWTQAPGATPDAPAIASGGGNLYVVVRGMDNKIYGVTVNPATWTFGVPWTVEPGATSSAPAIVWNPNGSLHVVVRGTNNGVYAATVNPADWSLSVPWTPLSGGSTPTAPAIGLSPPTGRVNILVTGMDNGLWEWASTFLY
jgi:hypothetical protein